MARGPGPGSADPTGRGDRHHFNDGQGEALACGQVKESYVGLGLAGGREAAVAQFADPATAAIDGVEDDVVGDHTSCKGAETDF